MIRKGGREGRRELSIWMPFNCLKLSTLLFSKVIEQTEDIIRCRIQQRNITTVVEKLQLCLPGESAIGTHCMTFVVVKLHFANTT